MIRDRFQRHLNGSVYLFGIFTPEDLIMVMVLLCINMVTVESVGMFLLSLLLLPVYILALRLGRDPGYDRHFFSVLFGPRVRRAGRDSTPPPRMRLPRKNLAKL